MMLIFVPQYAASCMLLELSDSDLPLSKSTRLRIRNELTYPYPDILSYEPAIYECKWSFGYVFYIRKCELKRLCILCQSY